LTKIGILLAALIIVWEKCVIGAWKYTPADLESVGQTKMHGMTHLLNSAGSLTKEGWQINAPWVVNNQENMAYSSLQKRNLDYL
jgi:hypothetical protein